MQGWTGGEGMYSILRRNKQPSIQLYLRLPLGRQRYPHQPPDDAGGS
jgi:hypothetical protein